MASTKDIKNRIRSVKNTAQITKAMEAVSATKMRRSQEYALRGRPYVIAAIELLRNLLERSSMLPPVLLSRPVKTSLLVVVTSDKGLAGALNANVIRKAEEWVLRMKKEGMPHRLITVGKKARDYFDKRRVPIERAFINFGDYSEITDTIPVADAVLAGFLANRWDEGFIAYTNFRTTMRQEALLQRMIPASVKDFEEVMKGILPEYGRYAEEASRKKESGMNTKENQYYYHYEYIFEPSSQELLDALVLQLLRAEIHHLILESNASEHSARMIAMKTASENAGSLIHNLQLTYNKARQAHITRELIEITAGREALEQ